MTRIVAGDLGATHARFAIAHLQQGARPQIGRMYRYRTSEHDGLVSAWRAFAEEVGEPLPDAASFGVAAPMDRGTVRFVNIDWTIDPARLGDTLELARITLLNDFGAVAHAVSVLEAHELEPILGPPGPLPSDGPITVLGPGTGLGVAVLLRRGERNEVIETEAGHIGFAPLNADEREVADDLAGRYGRASVERLVSGPALLDLYRHFGGGEWHVGNSGGLWSAALDQREAVAEQALDQLVKCLGSVAGDLVLAHGAKGLVITGGLANRMVDRLRSPLFGGRFIAKGRYRKRMESIPVRLCTLAEPGLLGAATAFLNEHLTGRSDDSSNIL